KSSGSRAVKAAIVETEPDLFHFGVRCPAPLTVLNGRRNKANQDVRLRHDCQEETPSGGEKTAGFGRNSTDRKSWHDKDLAKGSAMCPARVDFAPPYSIYIQNSEKRFMEAVMAAREARWGTMSSAAGAALALVGLAGLLGSLDHLARRCSDFFCISLCIAIETLPSISLEAWQISLPYLLCQLRVLEALLEISECCWRIVVILWGVA
ncbi:MAG TPA: hypothetical protein VM709_05840, partial [Candidatus Sulfotelmatobacter sp.]|nr:hypothetical protein [Candidatus Sulfotelmatobacter sp.]